MKLADRRVLLIIGGGIAAYKSLELIRRLRDEGAAVRCIVTAAAQEFVTPLSVGVLSADRVFTDLFDRSDEHDVGHIRLSRETDLIVVAPATADLMAKLATGLANDLASTVLLAADKPVLMAPAMNPKMWSNPATCRNRARLEADGVRFVGPSTGEMAESNESGVGRLAEVPEMLEAVVDCLSEDTGQLVGRRFLVTSGPTHEPLDPVRYIANRSSGKQGHAIAAALARAGAHVRLVTGPVAIPDPDGVTTVRVKTALEMLAAVEASLPVDGAVCVAAVADWRAAEVAREKMKKTDPSATHQLKLVENPDILATIGHSSERPAIVVGFAAETENILENAAAKLQRKGADLIVANDVSTASGVMGGDQNRVSIVSADGIDAWPELTKDEVANRLVTLITDRLSR